MDNQVLIKNSHSFLCFYFFRNIVLDTEIVKAVMLTARENILSEIFCGKLFFEKLELKTGDNILANP